MEKETGHPVIVIQRVGKRNTVSTRTLEEQTITNRRIKACGERLEIVTRYIESKFGAKSNFTHIKKIASYIAESLNIKIDRVSKRKKEAMLCWFTEHWDCVFPLLSQTNFTFEEVKPKVVCEENSSPKPIQLPSIYTLFIPIKASVDFQSLPFLNIV